MNKTQRMAVNFFCFKMKENISKYVKKDFEKIFLSGNLRDTLWVETINGIPTNATAKHLKLHTTHIPAIRYDIERFRKEGVIAHTPEKGSYAQSVDEYGGFSKTHKNYAENAIISAIKESYAKTQRVCNGVAKIEIEVKGWK